jgi:hypothetical protein
MKNKAKRACLLTVLIAGFVLPTLASDGEVKDESFFCKVFPMLCSAQTRGAGGTGHGD